MKIGFKITVISWLFLLLLQPSAMAYTDIHTITNYAPVQTPFDFNNNGKGDLTVKEKASGIWKIRNGATIQDFDNRDGATTITATAVDGMFPLGGDFLKTKLIKKTSSILSAYLINRIYILLKEVRLNRVLLIT